MKIGSKSNNANQDKNDCRMNESVKKYIKSYINKIQVFGSTSEVVDEKQDQMQDTSKQELEIPLLM